MVDGLIFPLLIFPCVKLDQNIQVNTLVYFWFPFCCLFLIFLNISSLYVIRCITKHLPTNPYKGHAMLMIADPIVIAVSYVRGRARFGSIYVGLLECDFGLAQVLRSLEALLVGISHAHQLVMLAMTLNSLLDVQLPGRFDLFRTYKGAALITLLSYSLLCATNFGFLMSPQPRKNAAAKSMCGAVGVWALTTEPPILVCGAGLRCFMKPREQRNLHGVNAFGVFFVVVSVLLVASAAMLKPLRRRKYRAAKASSADDIEMSRGYNYLASVILAQSAVSFVFTLTQTSLYAAILNCIVVVIAYLFPKSKETALTGQRAVELNGRAGWSYVEAGDLADYRVYYHIFRALLQAEIVTNVMGGIALASHVSLLFCLNKTFRLEALRCFCCCLPGRVGPAGSDDEVMEVEVIAMTDETVL